MEQAQYWMWMKRRQILKSDRCVWRSSINNSWEEKAFAEDALANHGGCIWPPRSYTCSFCKREFRSAQALGGHMNVHRRDRARLKQSDLSTQNQTQSFDYNNFPHEDNFCDLHPNSSVGSRVSGFSVQENLSEIKHNLKIEAKAALIKNPRDETYDDFDETELLMGLNPAVDNYSCKRVKTTGVSSFSLLIKKPFLSDRFSFKVPERSTDEAVSNSIQVIDLELRLG